MQAEESAASMRAGERESQDGVATRTGAIQNSYRQVGDKRRTGSSGAVHGGDVIRKKGSGED